MQEPMSRLDNLSEFPIVSQTPLDVLGEDELGTQDFFVRNHFEIPKIDIAIWRLTVGSTEDDFNLYSYDDLLKFPTQSVDVAMECAGNSRSSVFPPCEGMLWGHGGVGCVTWTGIPVKDILRNIKTIPEGSEVLFLGEDEGRPHGTGSVERYGMSIPMDKALDGETILAYKMNGNTLPNEHGYPVRLIVPGWYGMTSIKWVSEIRIVPSPHLGFYQDKYYVFVKDGPETQEPNARVDLIKVKSLITSLKRGQQIQSGKHIIKGKAWSGYGKITQVEFSFDNGKTWFNGEVDDSDSNYGWQVWRYTWNADVKGRYLVAVKATDITGVSQPEQFDWNFRGFANNSIHTLPVEVV